MDNLTIHMYGYENHMEPISLDISSCISQSKQLNFIHNLYNTNMEWCQLSKNISDQV